MATEAQKRYWSSIKGKPKKAFSEEHKRNMGLAQKGKKQPVEAIKQMVATRRKNGTYVAWNKGKHSEIPPEKHWHWKGGITPINNQIRSSLEYRLWRKAVYERDNYACIWCGIKGNGTNLNADHIKRFSDYPELRFAIDNGRTLCVTCHRTTDTYGTTGMKDFKRKKLL